jgi:tetratricopeptide (TPR) repeat protein
MGNAYSKLKQYTEAIKSYQRAIEINPVEDNVFNNLGIAYKNLKRYKEALKSYQRAIEINPENGDALLNLGIVFSNLKQYKKGITYFQKAIEIKPDQIIYNIMGITYSNLKQYKEAILSFKKAIEIKSDYDEAYDNMGNTFVQLKQPERAIESFKKAIEIDSKNDRVYNNLGLTYLKVNKIDYAFEIFYKGLEISPKQMYLTSSLLGAYVRVNDQNKSKELMNNLINKVENDLLTVSLTEDVFYNLFRFGSEAFIKSYFAFLLKVIFKDKKDKQLWKALADSLFNILINIVNYDKERLGNIEKALTELLAEYQESIIPLKMFSIGVAYLKNKEKNAIFKLSKEERKLFKEAVLDKINKP